MVKLGRAYLWKVDQKDDLDLKRDNKDAKKYFLDAAKRYEELNEYQSAVATYTLICEKIPLEDKEKAEIEQKIAALKN